MFIAKITLRRPIGNSSIYAIRNSKFVDWKFMHESQQFTTRQKARIAAKRCAQGSAYREIQILEVNDEIRQEMIVSKLIGH